MPGTLPYSDLEPHDGKGLKDLLKQAQGQSIGKLRLHADGHITLQLRADEGSACTLELNKGIESNFYQELVALDPHSQELHSLAPVT